ncbi:hypothetical protein [Aggregatibacter segnis]|mgnify:FL=1|uniref:hypothetical protein n=1 Tax=Aggregatibacter segnis TaxID=739 RepID=UPI000D6DF76B|nr:hypothetical protein [Aggregatibacter segnis]
MNTLKIKFDLREKVKGRHPVAVLQEHIDNLFYDPFNFEFEDGDIIGLKEKLNAFSNDPYFVSIIPRKIDELRKGYFYITATVMLERDGEDVGFVCQHIDSTLHACKEAILVEGEDNDFDILNLSSILNSLELFNADHRGYFYARYLVPKYYRVFDV